MRSIGKSFLFALFIPFFSCSYAIVGPVIPGQPIWGVTKRIGETTDIIESKMGQLDVIESKVCEQDSQLDIIESKIDSIDPVNICSLIEVVESKVCIVDVELDIVESKVCTVSSLIDVVESKVDEIPTFEILSQLDVVESKVCGIDDQLDLTESKICKMDSQLDLIEATGVETLAKVCEIESQQNIIESKIDAIDPENITSLIEIVESKVCLLDEEMDIVESKVCNVSSLMDVVESKVDEIPTFEILSQLDVIESKVCGIDDQLDIIEATASETLDKVCHIQSQQDVIESTIDLIEVTANETLAKVCSIDSQLDVIESKVDEIESMESQLDIIEESVNETLAKVCSIDSQLDVIESKVDAIDSIESQLELIEATGVETLAKVCGIESQQNIIESKIDAIDPENITSLIEVVESKVCLLDEEMDIVESKVCNVSSLMDVVESKVDEIPTFEILSQLDVIESKVCVIEDQVDLTESKVCHIQSQQDVIENTIDLIEATANEALAKVCSIDSQLDVIESKVDELQDIESQLDIIEATGIETLAKVCDIASQQDVIESKVDAIDSIESQLDLIEATGIETLAKVCEIESQQNIIESKIDAIDPEGIVSLIEVVESKVCILDEEMDVVESKVCTVSSLMDVVESKVDEIPTFEILSQLDVIESKVCVIEDQVDLTESKVCEIENQLDLIEATANETLAKVCSIDSQLDVIESKIDEIEENSSQLDFIESKICEIDSQLDVVESKVDAIDSIESQLDIIEATGIETLAKVCEIESQQNIIESKIDAIDPENITSLIEVVESKVCLLDEEMDIVESKVCNVSSLMDVVESKIDEIPTFEILSQLDVIESKIDELLLCEPGPIQSAGTISASGTYCLANDISGMITIAASNVILDLNNYQVTQGIIVNGGLDRITIKNGAVSGSGDAILVNGGTTGVTIENVVTKNAIRGINFNNVTGGTISNCDMTMNTTGLELDNCHKINVKDCVASCNTHAGFDLLSSTTNCFENCKALSTGEGNEAVTDNNVFGFVSTDGYGNIFERCIANSTQALTTTDYNSIVAGIALRGDEHCSKIIGCEASNSMTDIAGVTVPYGIWLENTVSDLSVAASASGFGTSGPQISVWSPDSKYVAIGGDNVSGGVGGEMQIFKFDRINQTLISVAGFFTSVSIVSGISWSPDGRYLAIGGGTLSAGTGDEFQILEFDRDNNRIRPITGLFGSAGGVNEVAWSPDGRFVAIAGAGIPGNNEFQLIRFDRVTESIDQIGGLFGSTGTVNAVDWSSDGHYIAVGGTGITGGTGDQVQILFFDGINIPTVVAGALGSAGSVEGVRWSPNGRYVTVTGSNLTGGSGDNFQILEFDGSSTLTPIVGEFGTTNTFYDSSWSSDGRYISLSTFLSLTILKFDPGSGTINSINSIATAGTPRGGVPWSPDGRYVLTMDGADLDVHNGLNFPQKNVIKDNVVYCNSGNKFPNGIGISGSSISNMIIQNTAYNNPQNYAFVTNIFNQLFGQAPSDLQNISLVGCDPICQPEDIATLIKQTFFKVCDVSSQLDVIESAVEIIDATAIETLEKVCAIDSKIDELLLCEPGPIQSAGTISASGTYCLANDIAGTITIAASNVILDLNNYQVTQGIVVNGGLDRITIKNGAVSGSGDAILVNGGSTNITVSDVVIKNAIRGINFNNVTGGTISNCEMTMNTTGLELDNCHKINVKECIASCNTHAGFDLLSSTTNCFENCKALSTGEGNEAVTDNNVFGFVSTDGYGNIFERCIANSTQALTTTDYGSVVAGIALRGDEHCSKIIGCEAANSMTDIAGVTVPYGILLEPTLSQLQSVSGALVGTVSTVAWSPDGKYIAVGGDGITGGTGAEFQLFEYDRVSNSLTPAGGTSGIAGTVYTVAWSPDGKYIAVGGDGITGGTGAEFQLFEYDRVSNSLTPAGGTSGIAGTVYTVAWSPDEQFIAMGGSSITGGSGDELQIFSFNRFSNTLTPVAGALGGGNRVSSAQWSPDGKFVAAVGRSFPGGDQFQVFEFDQSTNSLTLIASEYAAVFSIGSVSWSPDGNFLAVGGNGLGNEFQVVSFDRFNNTLTPVAGALGGGTGSVASVQWSSDGRFIAVGGAVLVGGSEFQVFNFDRSTNMLTNVGFGLSGAGRVDSISWSPDGSYFAVGGLGIVGGNDFQILEAFTFPQKNVIKDNVVYCNSGNECPGGIGLSGSSISNMIIQNTAYNNPQNYAFVTNIFNQLFGQVPSDLQNISLVGCDPICQPEDIATLIKQTLFKVCDVSSQLDVIESAIEIIDESVIETLEKVCGIDSKIDELLLCEPGPIQSAGTISASGTYCLANDISGTITIAASNVILDLNNYQVTQGIIVNGGLDRITIKNGAVSGSGDAILVNGGSTNITVSDVVIKNAIRGINFNNVTGGTISNCEMTMNTTGLELDNCHKINVKECIASCNTHAGFDLLSSTTNCFENCKALSTGEGNTNITDNNVFGFVSTDGYGNIFERCIANSTQALDTTDYNSVIAGFGLRGSESCSKIIECEAANSTSNPNGVTVPYGIWLEGTVDPLVTLTAVEGNGVTLNALDWSPDGKYLVCNTNFSGEDIGLFEYDREMNCLVLLDEQDINQESADLSWSPDGNFIAAGMSAATNNARIYEFDRINKKLTEIASFSHGGGLQGSAWSPDGQFVAFSGDLVGGISHRVFEFDRVARTLTLVVNGTNNADVQGIDWSPQGDFLVLGDDDGDVIVQKFDRFNNTLATVDTLALASGRINDVRWSSTGKYIAAGSTGGGDDLEVVSFTNNTLTKVAGVVIALVPFVSWSSDEQFIAVGVGTIIRVYRFDPGAGTLTLSQSLNIGDNLFEGQFSPDGSVIGVVSDSDNTGLGIRILSGITFPEKNVIKNNTLYCNSGNECPGGMGLCGSSIKNMIIQNTAYNNPQNYAFAANVFNQNFGTAPSDLQNISLRGCQPVCQPDDTNLLVRQVRLKVCDIEDTAMEILEKVCDIQTKVDIVLNEIDSVESKIDELLLCEPGPIQSAGTISASGTYCLANDISGTITIAASNVILDLNNYQVTQGIVVNGGLDRITIKNGAVSGSGDAILVNGGTTGVTIENVVTKNAIRGINFNNVTGGTISNCEMTMNTTGLELDNCHKINVKDCVASCNTHAGFDLLSSTTNCFENCKALSTGEGNTNVTDNNVFGFVSTDGYGNIFERCIANSTQALTTTDYNSIVAGIALRGDEHCSKIIGCEAANSMTDIAGVTVPYGIFLEPTLSDLELVAGALSSPGSQLFIDWSPDGRFIAIGGESLTQGTGDELQIVEFDRENGSLILVDGACGLVGAVRALGWSSDGNYLAVAGSSFPDFQLKIFEFDRINRKLNQIAGLFPTGTIFELEWSPDGRYIGLAISGGTFRVVEFDRIKRVLDDIAVISLSGTFGLAIDWSLDGTHLAVGGRDMTGGTGDQLQILSFDNINRTLTAVAGAFATATSVESVEWSPDGKYLAVGGTDLTVGTGVQIVEFDGSTVTPIVGAAINTSSVSWTSDGQFIGVADNPNVILKFDRGNLSLTTAGSVTTGGDPRTNTWSPDGRYLAISGNSLTGGNDFTIRNGLNFPEKNVIKDNVVYCNSGNKYPNGIGISGSSISNMIIQNTAYNNPQNYAFVTNIFNQLFGQGPSDLQNISLVGCDPIYQPEDIATLIKQTFYKVCDVSSQLDVIESAVEIIDATAIETLEKVCGIDSKIDELLLCEPGPIQSAGTISVSGTYCLANDISGTITIAASNVILDLNNYQVTQGIVVNGGLDRITIKNGAVSGSDDAILVNGGTTGVTIENVVTKNAIRGINLNNVTGGTISNCEMTMNTTGLELDNCHKINVKDCVASCNTHAGFDLLSSTTNCFENCKALSTGEGNTNITDNNVFGFVSTDGYGNIFERCIANSTQALTTTDYNSIVAGIALRGGEHCSKIIGCEAANSMTDIAGVTVPYGILLESTLSDFSIVDSALGTAGLPLFTDWSPDGNYLVVGGGSGITGGTGDQLQIVAFDRNKGQLTPLVGAFGATGTVRAVGWSPDGKYIAAGGTDLMINGVENEFWIFEFDRWYHTLIPVQGFLGSAGNLFALEWSPDGNFVGIAGGGLIGSTIQVLSFDKVRQTINRIASISLGGNGTALDWHPGGTFLAVGGSFTDDKLKILEFDAAMSTLSTATSALEGTSIGAVEWSSDGKFIVAAGTGLTGGTGDIVQILEFDGANSVTAIAGALGSAGTMRGVSWSSDDRFISVAGINVAIAQFDRGDRSLNVIETVATGGVPRSAPWSPDGAYLAVGGDGLAGGQGDFQMRTGLNFPQKNVIKDNVVYCNSGNECPGGIGLSGSSISNMIIQNTSYNNPQNYAFVANVFNQFFGQAPSDLQNIALVGCDPIYQPEDITTLVKQTLFKACDISSQLDVIESAVEIIDATAVETLEKVCMIKSQEDVIESKLDALTTVTLNATVPCAPTEVTGAVTISNSGNYCVANDISGTITIAASDVSLDLNNRAISAGIVVNGGLNHIIIKNGSVSGSGDAILVNGGTTGITIENVITKNAIRGINFNNVTGGTISNCEMTMNTTGLGLDNCHKINVTNCVASCNTHAGFDLLSSTTNCFENCKALSTGEGNEAVTDNNVFGFVSANGYGNIFERCISNSTQALTTTDSNSIIAGFALRGTEGCSKIIDSEAANSMTAVSGVTVPYGIFLEPHVEQITTLTEASVTGNDGLLDVNWSPDGKYIVAGLLDITTGKLFEYDRENDLAILLTTLEYGAESHTIKWHPSGQFIAIAGENQGSPSVSAIFVYQFDPINKMVSRIATFNHVSGSSFVYDSSWSPDGLYVAIAGTSGGTPTASHRILRFDSVIRSLTEVGFRNNGATTRAIDWSHSNDLIVTGDDDGILHVDTFNRASNVLESVTSITVPISAANINSAKWSPDDKYIAVGTDATGSDLFIYRFEGNTLVLVDSVDLGGSNVVNQVDWSSDGRYLAVAHGVSFLSGSFSIYLFDRGIEQLRLETNGAASSQSDASTVSWSPDGTLLAGGIRTLDPNKLKVLTGLTFPQKNVIKSNTVYCNSGNELPGGIGISGSSIKNMIIGNVCYNSPQNYAFAANVYNQKFSAAPSDVQNIALDGCTPICLPDDTNLIARQTLNKVCDIQTKVDIVLDEVDIVDSKVEVVNSKVDVIDSQLDIIEDTAMEILEKVCDIQTKVDIVLNEIDSVESKVDELLLCEPGPIQSAGTISVSGTYCLANDISGMITIAASNVILDLNNYQVTQGIVVNGGLDRIIIKNGAVSGSGDAILVNDGTTGVTIENVVVKNAIRGINFNNVTSGTISNCEMTMNTTGLQLNGCHKITVKDCTASCNTDAGYDLLSSTTNCFENCKALSTGAGNMTISGDNIFGFVSANGYGNIFERCIANSTQALTMTGFNSIVAGFALRGSEGCSKIIECEAANSMADESGVTSPYGIYLEPQIEGFVTFTELTSVSIESAGWSPSGKYIALGSNTSAEGFIYRFDPEDTVQMRLIDIASLTSNTPRAAKWSPNERYVAFASGGTLEIFSFNPLSGVTLRASVALGATISDISWSNSGRFIAIIGPNLQLYEFRPDTVDGLILVQSVPVENSLVTKLHWVFDDRYLVIGGPAPGGLITVYRFTPGLSAPLIEVDSFATVISGSFFGTGVAWSPDGRYIAAVESDGSGVSGGFALFSFDRTSESVTLLDFFTSSFLGQNGLHWSPDGKLISVPTVTTISPLLSFNPAPPRITQLATAGDDSDSSMPFSPDGRYLLLGNNTLVRIYNVMNFPEKNVIKNNVVYCNSNLSTTAPRGVGISGSNIANMIMGNKSYNNPQSYNFVTNIFDGLSNSLPSLLQNIGILGCQPPAITGDVMARLDILEGKMCDMQSKIDAILLAV